MGWLNGWNKIKKKKKKTRQQHHRGRQSLTRCERTHRWSVDIDREWQLDRRSRNRNTSSCLASRAQWANVNWPGGSVDSALTLTHSLTARHQSGLLAVNCHSPTATDDELWERESSRERERGYASNPANERTNEWNERMNKRKSDLLLKAPHISLSLSLTLLCMFQY